MHILTGNSLGLKIDTEMGKTHQGTSFLSYLVHQLKKTCCSRQLLLYLTASSFPPSYMFRESVRATWISQRTVGEAAAVHTESLLSAFWGRNEIGPEWR